MDKISPSVDKLIADYNARLAIVEAEAEPAAGEVEEEVH